MNEIALMSLEDLGAVLRAMAKASRVTVTGLVRSTGKTTTSLVGLANGTNVNQDANALPVLRILESAGWELVARPKDGESVTISRPGALPLRVVAADGGPLEVVINDLAGFATLINTMALANDRTPTGLAVDAKINSSVLISLATGRDFGKDIRFSGLWKLIASAGFVLYARPRHRTAREARLAAEVGQYLPRK